MIDLLTLAVLLLLMAVAFVGLYVTDRDTLLPVLSTAALVVAVAGTALAFIH